jgi:hypothetical protein
MKEQNLQLPCQYKNGGITIGMKVETKEGEGRVCIIQLIKTISE